MMPVDVPNSADEDMILLARDLRDLASRLVDALEDRSEQVRPKATTLSVAERRDPPLDGSWSGCMPNGAYTLRLRLDREVSARLSGELGRAGSGGFEWVCSFATNPEERVLQGASSWPIRFKTATDEVGEGRLGIAWISAEEILATVALTRPPAGFPFGTSLFFPMRREGAALRRVLLHTVVESVGKATAKRFRVIEKDFVATLSEAGFDASCGKRRSIAGGAETNRGWGQAEILDAVYRQRSEKTPDDSVDLDFDLILALGSARPGLLSFAVDPGAALDRRSIVVFASEGEDRRLPVQQALQQLGAACGLLPRRHPRVARPESPMNDPAGFIDGERAFWDGFTGRFDPDELAHLRHASLVALRHGRRGAESPYWARCLLQPPPPDFVRGDSGLLLELLLPDTGPLLELGQPLFLTVRLVNGSNTQRMVDTTLLDLKRGALVVEARRLGWSPVQATPQHFRPTIRRQMTPSWQSLPPGESIENNLQVGFGRDGAFLGEPGTYEVTAHLDLPAEGGTVRIGTPPLRLRVSEPPSRAADRDALDLLDSRAGLFLALGGIRSMSRIADNLAGLAAERVARGETDGVVAAIWRALAIDEGRAYPSLTALERENRMLNATGLMGRLDAALLAFFDRRTTNDFLDLKRRQERRLASNGGTAAGATKGKRRRTSGKVKTGNRKDTRKSQN
jgi:hypothetical protein